MTNKQNRPACAVCGESSHAVCASGRCFCTKHSTCGRCHLKLANGELQWALISLGSVPGKAQANLHAVRDGNIALGTVLVTRAIIEIKNGRELVHGPGDECRVSPDPIHPASMTPAQHAQYSGIREIGESTILSAAVN